ncbi:tRNA-uridine aminocarboxypropyltransferase [Rheinheimera sp. 1928-s]|uniref:DTW domain-containing protein n=1 Tax=Rheinheimera sp. 1928-s TaxID=3033803 RepID=UPI0026038ADD|nr:tRNA-uridine aminocarboxypropyltransferase [Rheinheimera sp. 1928-s]MDF3127322.1 DTW domain-containing protein [Rheinheimera sp. 1928-s]
MPELVLYLLTHSRELHKATNTGALALQALAASLKIRVELIEWQRKEPDVRLLELATQQQLGLVYPLSPELMTAETPVACYLLQLGLYQPQNLTASNQLALRQAEAVRHWLLVDATWQEAAKMLRQSPYLQSCYRLGIATDQPSSYRLRRNQKEGALCTAEVVIELLLQSGYPNEKEQLMLLFDEFNKR